MTNHAGSQISELEESEYATTQARGSLLYTFVSAVIVALAAVANLAGTPGVFNHDHSVPIYLVGAAAVIGIGTAVFARRLLTAARKARLADFGAEERLVFLAISYGLFITIVPAGLVSALGTLVLFITSL